MRTSPLRVSSPSDADDRCEALLGWRPLILVSDRLPADTTGNGWRHACYTDPSGDCRKDLASDAVTPDATLPGAAASKFLTIATST
jgi:hypothetical protein